MRSTAELITELEDESRQHLYVTLIVGFENSTIPIHATDEDRQQVLNDALKHGGHPVGLIAFDHQGPHVTFKTRVYPEHTGDAAAQAMECLRQIAEITAKSLKLSNE